MNNEPLMDVVVQTVLFLELSDQNIVDDDAAVAMLESIAATLQGMSGPEKEAFKQYLRARVAQSSDHKERQVLEAMADALGI
jgi:hypothetical protein